ncbi:MAG: hypothetical protein ACP5GY_01650 [Vulcanisaeta sp.]
MNNSNCLEELMNSLMTIYSISIIEHYMILLMIIKAGKGADIQDQLINALREHLDKESRLIKSMEKLNLCLDTHAIKLINDYLRNISEGLSLINDAEFISNYINNFTDSLKTLLKYLVIHNELLIKIINLIQEAIDNLLKINEI